MVDDLVRAIVGNARDQLGDLYDVRVYFHAASGAGRFVPFVVYRSVTTDDFYIRTR